LKISEKKNEDHSKNIKSPLKENIKNLIISQKNQKSSNSKQKRETIQ
jgi:hypothetical protein